MSSPITLPTLLADFATTQPDAIALSWCGDSGEAQERWSYAELYRRACGIASRLVAAGITPGERVLLLPPQGLPYVAGFYGALLARVIPVTLPAPRSRRSVERVRLVAQDCAPAAMLVTRAQQAGLQSALAAVPALAALPQIVLDEEGAEAYAITGLPAAAPADLAFLQYTSGSTSQPKGVAVTHGNLAHQCALIRAASRMDGKTIFVTWLPLNHDMGLIGTLLAPLACGGRTVLLCPAAVLQRPLLWLETATWEKASMLGAPDFGYAACTLAAKRGLASLSLDLTTLKTVWTGAEPVRPDTLARFTRAFADVGFSANTWLPCYGMAESTLMITGHKVGGPPVVGRFCASSLAAGRAEAVRESEDHRALTSCGRPQGGMEVVMVSPEDASILPEGRVGEVWVRGESVASGYFGKPELTEEIFSARTADGSGPWMRTGDLGFLLNGELYPCGRLKDMIKLRGRNLYPQDVEAAVAEVLPWLAPNGCAVFAVEKDGTEALGLLIEADRAFTRTLKKHASGDATAAVLVQEALGLIRQAVTEETEAAPALIAFTSPADFPRTTSGKVQRQISRVIATTAGDERVLLITGSAVPPPASDEAAARDTGDAGLLPLVAETLLSVLRDQVDGSFASVDVDVPLSRYGMDSLATVEASVRLEKATGRKLPPDILTHAATAREIATALDREYGRATAVLDAKSGADAAPPSSVPFPRRMAQAMDRFNRLRAAERYPYHPVTTGIEGQYVTMDGRRMLMLGSYEYLTLLDHPRRIKAAKDALDQFGAGTNGVPVLAGRTSLHVELEARLATLMRAEDAIVYTSGYMTNLATVATFTGPGDVVIGDALNHASIVDGCRYSGARFITFLHNDMAALERLLADNVGTHTLVVTEGVYSMDGDIGRLPEISALCRKYGAYLMVDEAHSLGVIGKHGRGVQEHCGLPDDAIDLKMGTLSKALGGVGGFVAGKAEIIDYFRHQSRGYLFSGALTPPNAGASIAALDVLESEPWRVERLHLNARRWRDGLMAMGFDTFTSETPIVPVAMPDEMTAFEFAHRCRKRGVFIVPVVFPAVPQNAPRLRTCVTAGLTDADLDTALEVMECTGKELLGGRQHDGEVKSLLASDVPTPALPCTTSTALAAA